MHEHVNQNHQLIYSSIILDHLTESEVLQRPERRKMCQNLQDLLS